MAIISRKLAFIDVETTGFDSAKHEIIELGAVIAVQQPDMSWRTISEIDVKVKPERIEDADEGALRVNGYDPGNWMFAHTLTEAMTELSTKAKDAIMVAHNISFDYSFINQAYQVTGVENTMHFHKLDTISIAFAKHAQNSELRGWSLRALCEYYGIVNTKAHTALSDAQATFEVFKELMKEK